MNVDVTNTQEGGQEPVAKPEDFKANITPPKTVQPAEAIAPTAEVPVATQEAQAISEPKPIQETSNEVKIPEAQAPVEEDVKQEHEFPSPINTDEADAVDFSVMDMPHSESVEPEVKKEEEQNAYDFNQADAFHEMDLAGDSEKEDTTPENLFVPKITSPFTLTSAIEKGNEINKLAGNNVEDKLIHREEVVLPQGAYKGVMKGGIPDGQGTLKTNDGNEIVADFKEGSAEGSAIINFLNGGKYVGNVQDGQAQGIGTYTSKNGDVQHGFFEKGKLVTPIKQGTETDKQNAKDVDVKNAFKPLEAKDISKNFEENHSGILKKIVTPLRIEVETPHKANTTFNAMQGVDHQKVSEIAATNGIDLSIDRDKELDKVNVTSTLKQLNNLLPKELKARVARGEKLTPQQKSQLEDVLHSWDDTSVDHTYLEKHRLAGEFKDFHKLPTKEVLKRVYDFSNKAHAYLDELKQPEKKELDAWQQAEANQKNIANQIKNKLKPGTQEKYGSEVSAAVDFIMSKEYKQYVNKELTTGDKIVNDKLLKVKLDKAYKQWTKENGASEGYVSRSAFDNTIGKDIKQLHVNLLEAERAKYVKSENNFGFKKAQEIIEKDNRILADAKANAIIKVSNKISKPYIDLKLQGEQKLKQSYEATYKDITEQAKNTFQQSVSALSGSNPQIKSVTDEYNQRLLNAKTDSERADISKELHGKLIGFKEYKDLSDAYQTHLNSSIETLNTETLRQQIELSSKIREAYMSDFSKSYDQENKAIERKSGYLAQYNVYNKTDELQNSGRYKKASYQEKKALTEEAWNMHVMDATKFFKQKEIPTPANEDERLNKHFTEWTGAKRTKTAEDLAVYQSLISKAAHDKFRVYANYNELNSEKPNTFQFKAMLQDNLAEVNAHLEYITKTEGKNAYHNPEYVKWSQQKRMIEKGLDMPENEANTMEAFLKGFAEGDLPFISSILRANESNTLTSAAERFANGTANRADAGLLMTKHIKGMLDQLAPTSFVHNLGSGFMSTLSYMGETVLMGGTSEVAMKGGFALAQQASKKAVQLASSFGVKQALTKTTQAVILNQLSNPKFISTAGKALGIISSAITQGVVTGRANAEYQQRYAEHVAPQFMFAQAGGYDRFIAQIEKGDEGNFEAMVKAAGITFSDAVIERMGVNLTFGLGGKAGKEVADFIASNKFTKRTLFAEFVRRKGFESADDVAKYIEKSGIGNVVDEMGENIVSGISSDIITGDRDALASLSTEEQGTGLVATLLSTVGMGSVPFVAKKIRVNTNTVSTHINYTGADNEGLTATLPTDVWNKFNKQVGKKEFSGAEFANFVHENKLSLPQQQALAHVYVKTNPKAIEDISKIKQHIEELSNGIVDEDALIGGDVEVANQSFTEPAQENEDEGLSLREQIEEEQNKTENNDNQNQTGLPSEIGRTEEPIQTEPNQETGSQATETGGVVQGSREVTEVSTEEISNAIDNLKSQGELMPLFPLLTKGNHTSKNPEEIAKEYNEAKRNGTNQRLVDEVDKMLSKNKTQNESTTTTDITTDGDLQPTPEQGTEAGTSEGVQPTVEPATSKGNAKVEPIRERLKKIEPTTPIDFVLQHFVNGGRINENALQEVYGDKSGKSIKGEEKARRSLINKENGKSINDIAQQLWEDNSHLPYEGNDYVDAIHQVLNDFNTPTKMRDEYLRRNEVPTETLDVNQIRPEEIHHEDLTKHFEDLKAFEAALPNVEENVTRIASDEEKRKAREKKQEEELKSLPVVDDTKNNPFTELKKIRNSKSEMNNFRKKYSSDIANIEKIESNFEDIISQLGDKIKTKDC